MEHHVLDVWTDIATASGKSQAIMNADAVVIFDNDLNAIVWSNVSGADLFGGCDIASFIGQKFATSHPFIRQLDAATKQIDDKPVTRAFRVVSDDGGHLLQCVVERVALSKDGSQVGICVTCQNKNFADFDEVQLSQNLLDGLDISTGAAILDQYGLPIAANTQWGDADLDIDLVEEALAHFNSEPGSQPLPLKTAAGQTVSIQLMAVGKKRLLGIMGEASEEFFEQKAAKTFEEIETVSPLPLLDEIPGASDDDSNIDDERSDVQEQLPLAHDETTKTDNSQSHVKPSGENDKLEDKQEPVGETQPVKGGRPFRFNSSANQIRFSWTTNTEQEFTSVSEEFAQAVGPNAADIVGRNWRDVAQVFGFDQTGEIYSLLQHQDTWSGKCVAWPIQGTDLVAPVDLAALPSFSSGRNFEGFRGFGIVRLVDAIVDPDETGMALSETSIQTDEDVSILIREDEDESEGHSTENDTTSTRDRMGDNVVSLAGIRGGNNGEEIIEPSESISNHDEDLNALEREFSADAQDGQDDQDNNHNSETSENSLLSDGENQAFDEIGRKLRTPENDGIDLEQDLESQFELSKDPIQPTVEAPLSNDQDIDVRIIEQLPFPILIFRNGIPLYANPEFYTLTGHDDLDAFSNAGGIDTLFGERDEIEGDALVNLNASDGTGVKVKAIIKSVPWDDKDAMMVTFRQPKHEQLPNEEKIALDMMRVSELENILDTATDGILILDGKGRIESANQSAEALFGKPHDVIEDGTIYEQFATESHASIREYLDALSEPGVKSILNDGREVIGIEENGGLIPLFITIGKVGRTGKYCAVLRDITQWKKASEELVAAKKEAESASDQKTDFLARISHEIRTPLNAIIGFSDVMIEERFGPIENKRYREYLRDINRSGVHVLELINDLLDISKIEAGKMELSFESVDLNKIVSETVALLQPQANGEQVLIRTSLSRAVPNVVADARSIRQIVLNLVSNAIKFTQANGQVVVSTVYEGNGEVALRIRDTGRGMSEEEVTKAMKPFQQVNSMSERRDDGTGLGLPLTKALVEANKAYFDIESERDEGTIVHIQFPSQRVLAD